MQLLSVDAKAETKLHILKEQWGTRTEHSLFFKFAITVWSLSPKRIIVLWFFFGLGAFSSGKVCDIYWAINLKENNNKKNVKIHFNNSLLVTNIQHNF